MALRDLTRSVAGGALATGMARLNARHPWSHNDHFHRWILRNLPARRRAALDVGCGRGELVAALAPRFGEVIGTGTWELPQPTVLLIDTDGRVAFVEVSPDWLDRTEAGTLIDAVDRIGWRAPVSA